QLGDGALQLLMRVADERSRRVRVGLELLERPAEIHAEREQTLLGASWRSRPIWRRSAIAMSTERLWVSRSVSIRPSSASVLLWLSMARATAASIAASPRTIHGATGRSSRPRAATASVSGGVSSRRPLHSSGAAPGQAIAYVGSVIAQSGTAHATSVAVKFTIESVGC